MSEVPLYLDVDLGPPEVRPHRLHHRLYRSCALKLLPRCRPCHPALLYFLYSWAAILQYIYHPPEIPYPGDYRGIDPLESGTFKVTSLIRNSDPL